MIIMNIMIIIIISWFFIGKEFLWQLHKLSKNNFTNNDTSSHRLRIGDLVNTSF